MCDQAKYSALDERVDSIDQRLSSCEKELATIKDDCRTGFSRVETAMNNVLEERRAWSAWARENLPKVGLWLARWLIREEISTNALCKVEVYSNEVTGAIWRYRTPFKPKPFVSSRNAKAYTASTNGVPARLAAIRAKRAAQLNAGIVTTNVVVNATGK